MTATEKAAEKEMSALSVRRSFPIGSTVRNADDPGAVSLGPGYVMAHKDRDLWVWWKEQSRRTWVHAKSVVLVRIHVTWDDEPPAEEDEQE